MSDLVNGPAGGTLAACIHPHCIARIASASLHACLSSSTTHPSLRPPSSTTPSHPSPTYPQRRSVCATRPPSPRVMPAIHPICPAPGPAHARPAFSSLAQHGQTVRLVALCRARRPPEVRRAETRPGSRRPVQCCVRSSALLSQIANTRPLRSPACSSSSLPASRNWHRRPVRPSRSFTTAIPTMPRTRRIMLPCTIHSHHPARTSPHIFFFFCACPGAQKQCIVARVAYRHIGAHVCINPPQMSLTRLQTSTRARRVCRNTGPSPSNLVPNEHPPSHNNQKHVCRPP